MAIQRIPPTTLESVEHAIEDLEQAYGSTEELLSNALNVPDDVSADWYYLLSQRASLAALPRRTKVLMYGTIDLDASAAPIDEQCIQLLCAA